jgi:hypothetical protein
MTKMLSLIGLVLVVLVVGGIATCSLHAKLLSTDAGVQPALERAAAASQPLLRALEAYHHQHGYFPSHIEALSSPYPLPPEYVYEVIGMNRVYESFACAARSAEFYGVIRDPTSYPQPLADFLRECVSGYSAFVLKSQRIHTARSVNSNVVAFAKFSSQGGRWELDWCDSNPTPHEGDCRHFPMNEAGLFAEAERRPAHGVVYVSPRRPQNASHAQ